MDRVTEMSLHMDIRETNTSANRLETKARERNIRIDHSHTSCTRGGGTFWNWVRLSDCSNMVQKNISISGSDMTKLWTVNRFKLYNYLLLRKLLSQIILVFLTDILIQNFDEKDAISFYLDGYHAEMPLSMDEKVVSFWPQIENSILQMYFAMNWVHSLQKLTLQKDNEEKSVNHCFWHDRWSIVVELNSLWARGW